VAKRSSKIKRCFWSTDIPSSLQTYGLADRELRTDRLSVILQEFLTSNITWF